MKVKKKLFHTLLVSQEPVLIWQEGLQLNQLLLVSGNPGIIFHFSHDLFWTYYGARTSFLARGVHRARAYHSTFESARYRKQIWRRAAIFVQVLI